MKYLDLKQIFKDSFKKHKIAKVFTLIIILLMVFYFMLSSSWFLTGVVLPGISKSFGIKLSAERCKLSLFSAQIIFEEVYFSDEKEISIRFDKMTIKSSLSSFFQKKIHLKNITLENSEITYQKFKNSKEKFLDQKIFAGVLDSEERNYNESLGYDKDKKTTKELQLTSLKNDIQKGGKKTVNFIADHIAEKLKNINIDSMQLKNVNVKIKFINQQKNPTEIELKDIAFDLKNLALGKKITIRNNFTFGLYAENVANIEQANVTSILECFIEKDGKIKGLKFESETFDIIGNVKKIKLEKHFFRLNMAGEGVNDVFTLKEFTLQQFNGVKKLVSSVASSASTRLDPFLGTFKVSINKVSPELMTIIGVVLGDEIIGDCSPQFEGSINYTPKKIVADGKLMINFKKSRQYPTINSLINDEDSFLRILNYHVKNIKNVDAILNYNLVVTPVVDDVEIKKLTLDIKNNLTETFALKLTKNIKFSFPILLHKLKLKRHYLHPFKQGAVRCNVSNFRLDKLINSIVDKRYFIMNKGHFFGQFDLELNADKKIYYKIDNNIKNMGMQIKEDKFKNANYEISSEGILESLNRLTFKNLKFTINDAGNNKKILRLHTKNGFIALSKMKFDLQNNNILVYDSVVNFLPHRYLKDQITVDLKTVLLEVNSKINLDLNNNNISLSDYKINVYKKNKKNLLLTANAKKEILNINYDQKNNGSVLSYPLNIFFDIKDVSCSYLNKQFLKNKIKNINDNVTLNSSGSVNLTDDNVKIIATSNLKDVTDKIKNIFNQSVINYSIKEQNIIVENSEFKINKDLFFSTLGNVDMKRNKASLQMDITKLNNRVFSFINQKTLADKFKFTATGKSAVEFNFIDNDFEMQTLLNIKNINNKKNFKGKIILDLTTQKGMKKFILNSSDLLLFNQKNNIADLNFSGRYSVDNNESSLVKIKSENLNITEIIKQFKNKKISSKNIIKTINNGETSGSNKGLEESKSLLELFPDKELEKYDLHGLHLQYIADLNNMKYRDISSSLKAQGLVRNNVILLDKLVVDFLGGGRLAADGAINIGVDDGYTFRVNSGIDKLPLTNIMNSLLPTVKKYSHGVMKSLIFEMVGKGMSKINVKKNLKLSLRAYGKDFFIPNDYASIRGYRLIFIPLEVLGRLESFIPNIITFKKVTTGLKNISDVTTNVNGFSFYSGLINLNFQNGVFYINNFSMQGYLVREINLVGTVDLYDQEKLDLKALLRVPFLDFPFEIKGYLLKPKTIYRKSLKGVIKSNTIKFFDSLKKSGDAVEEGSGYIFKYFKNKL